MALTCDLSDPSEREKVLKSIQPAQAKSNHELLKSIFLQEMTYRDQDGCLDYYENLYWCAFLLFCVGDLHDVELMWQAKHINMDTGTGFENESFFAAGIQNTFSFLRLSGLEKIATEMQSAYGYYTEQEILDWFNDKKQYYYPDASDLRF